MPASRLLSKINQKTIKKTKDLLASYLKYFQNSGVVSGKASVPSTVLILMLEKWKHAVNNKKVFGALLTDLLKAFNCICHDLLIAKLNAYGLSLPSLKLVHNYLQSRKHRTKNGCL